MKKTNLLLHVFTALVFAAELLSRLGLLNAPEYLFKPLLMPLIALLFVLNSRGRTRNPFIFLAFLFSWIGDIFLMLSATNELMFYAGVGGFFFAQLSYIKVFSVKKQAQLKGLIQRKPFLLLLFAAYLTGILALILGDLKGVMIPVIIIYAICLITMSVMALNRFGIVNSISFRLVFIGSLLFVISDSMIAINKFYASFPLASFLIMLTYLGAQYLIMMGLSREQVE
jgi:uncharacterized membrane protein YhhN